MLQKSRGDVSQNTLNGIVMKITNSNILKNVPLIRVIVSSAVSSSLARLRRGQKVRGPVPERGPHRRSEEDRAARLGARLRFTKQHPRH